MELRHLRYFIAAAEEQHFGRASEKLHVTCVVVSHDLRSIFGIAERIAMLYKGRVRLVGTPEDFRASKDAVVRQFVEGRAEGPMESL